MMPAQQINTTNGESQTATKVPGLTYGTNRTLPARRPKRKVRSISPTEPHNLIETYDIMHWTATIDSQEVSPMDEIRKDVGELKIGVAELNKDIKSISKSLEPIPQLTIDVAIMKNSIKILLWFTGGILLTIIAGLIIGSLP